jgi:predicted nucleic acid-binding protein
MGWVDSLRGSKVGLDTTPLIYFTEENSSYWEVVVPFFNALSVGEFEIVTSMMTLLEALVRPVRDGDLELAQEYRDFLLQTENLTTFLLDQEISEEAARLRAFHNIRTPDSIQMATAIVKGASFFLTNDTRLPSLPNLKTLVLDNLKKEIESQQSSTEP